MERIPLILSALLALIQSLLYLKIRCIEHGFCSPHLLTLVASGLDDFCLQTHKGTVFGIREPWRVSQGIQRAQW